MKKVTICILLTSVIFALTGCDEEITDQKYWDGQDSNTTISKTQPAPKVTTDKTPQAPQAAPVAKVVKKKYHNINKGNITTSYFPSTDDPVIRMDKKMPATVRTNKTFDYTIKVTNLTQGMLENVIVTEKIAEGFKYKSSYPQAKAEGNELTWAIDSVKPGRSVTLKITGDASDVEYIGSCTKVTYSFAQYSKVMVVKPKLKLTKVAPESSLICNNIPYTFFIKNSGTGLAEAVKITDELPDGLLTASGENTIQIEVGDLQPGQSKKFDFVIKAQKAGRYVSTAYAQSEQGFIAQSDTVVTTVNQPILSIAASAPQKQYIGKEIVHTVNVTNHADVDATDAVLVSFIPTGIEKLRASTGAALSKDMIKWQVGTIPANSTKEFRIIYTPLIEADFVSTTELTAACADTVSAQTTTSVTGIAAILLEVVDVSDPVRVGENETYVITATNQGSSPDTNITITCQLEDNQQFVSSSGATDATVNGNTITFAPLPSLSPKSKATWRVIVKSLKAGDVRFNASMDTDQLTRPVAEAEATHLYE